MLKNNDEETKRRNYLPLEEINNEEKFCYENNVPEVIFQNELYEEYQIYVDEAGKEYIYMNGEPVLLEEADDIIYEEAVQDYSDEKAYQYFKETQLVEPPIYIGKNRRRKRKQSKNHDKPKIRETAYDNMKIVDRKTCGQQKLLELIDKNSMNVNCLTCNMEYFVTKQSYSKYKIVLEKNEKGGNIYNFVCPVCSVRSTCVLV